MTRSDHHDWTKTAADRLFIGGTELWRALASAWTARCSSQSERQRIVTAVEDAINGLAGVSAAVQAEEKQKAEARAAATAKMEAEAAAMPPPKDDTLPDRIIKHKERTLFETIAENA